MFYYYRRQIKAVIFLLIIAGVVYGGIKAVMHYKVTRALDELALEAVGRAELTYGEIETDVSGEVRVLNLNLLPTGAPQPITVDVLRVTGPHAGFFVWEQKDNEPPPKLKMELLGIRLPLEAGMFEAIEEQFSDETADANTVLQDGCGSDNSLDPSLLRKLGLNALDIDVSAAYDYDAKSRQLSALMDFDIQGIENAQASLNLADVAPEIFEGGGSMDSIPSLAGMSFDMHVDREFAERYVQACAEKRGQEKEAYRQSLIAETVASLSKAGFQLGDGLNQALEMYHRQWGDIHASIDPAEPINLMAFILGGAQDWQRKLGLRVTMNAVEISDLSLEVRPPNARELAIMMGEDVPPALPTKPRDRYRYAYHAKPLAALNQYIGAQVRLHLSDEQPMRSGILKAVVGNEARVEQRLHAGKITAHVPLADIVKLEVQEVEKITP